MSDAEIRDELLTLLVAGHETTATALSWAMERLIRHPEKLERLRAEVAGRRGRLPDGDDPGDAAPAAGDRRSSIRQLTEPVEIGGYELPAGVSVTPCIHLSTATPRSTPNRTASCPSASSRTRPAPTPGSPSAAASAAASAPPSPSSRWPSSSGSWSSATRSARPTPSPSAPSAARSPRPRATTPRSSSAERSAGWHGRVSGRRASSGRRPRGRRRPWRRPRCRRVARSSSAVSSASVAIRPRTRSRGHRRAVLGLPKREQQRACAESSDDERAATACLERSRRRRSRSAVRHDRCRAIDEVGARRTSAIAVSAEQGQLRPALHQRVRPAARIDARRRGR